MVRADAIDSFHRAFEERSARWIKNGEVGQVMREKTAQAEVPKDVTAAIAKNLSSECLQLLDGSQETICNVWLRKEVPSIATDAQV